MAHVAEHELPLGSEKLVVFHVAGHVGIGPRASRRPNQKSARPAAQRHRFNGLFKCRVPHHRDAQLLLEDAAPRDRTARTSV